MSREYNTPKQEATSGLANPRANQVNRRVRAYVRVSYKLITSLRPALPVFHRHRCRLHLSQSFVNVRRLLDGIEGFSHPVMLGVAAFAETEKKPVKTVQFVDSHSWRLRLGRQILDTYWTLAEQNLDSY